MSRAATCRRYHYSMKRPKATSDAVVRCMRANSGTGTSTEIRMAEILSKASLLADRNCITLPGKPDFAFGDARLALFVNGCYWHRCMRCKPPTPKANRSFWVAKFKRTVRRDRAVRRQCRTLGWATATVWECSMAGPNFDEKVVRRIRSLLKKASKSTLPRH